MAWDYDNLAPQECLLFHSKRVKVGRFCCSSADPCFRQTASLDNDVFVFVRQPLMLQRGTDNYRFVGPGDILLHRSGATLHRRSVATFGDYTYWFGLHPGVFLETLRQHQQSSIEMGDALVADPLLRFRLALLTDRLSSGENSPLHVEETVINLFDDICLRRHSETKPQIGCRLDTAVRRRRLVDRAREHLQEHLGENLTLQDVADASGASLYHLCRVFRQETQLTLHAYLTRQRLGRAVEKLADDSDCNLTELAFSLGFSSHSHFSRVFSSQLGVTPSAMRSASGSGMGVSQAQFPL